MRTALGFVFAKNGKYEIVPIMPKPSPEIRGGIEGVAKILANRLAKKQTKGEQVILNTLLGIYQAGYAAGRLDAIADIKMKGAGKMNECPKEEVEDREKWLLYRQMCGDYEATFYTLEEADPWYDLEWVEECCRLLRDEKRNAARPISLAIDGKEER